MNEQNLVLNKVKNRLLILSPTVKQGLEPECQKGDFSTEGTKPLGKGGFGEVWKVIHKKTNNVYVIKVIDKKNIIDQKLVDQMNREIEIMYKVNHPHIVKLVNHFEDDNKFYLILHYASRGQLYYLLKKNGKFDEKTVAQFIRETLEAVKYLQTFDPPIIHRDIKPENLLLDENLRIKLADFGWSNFKDTEKKRITYCGTPEYLSPEMVEKLGHDASVDIWSIGVLMFELISGYAPFSGNNQDELFNNIKKLKINWPIDFPLFAKNLITRILRLNPKDRMSIDEILNHTWFDKNPLIKPVLKYKNLPEEELIRSFMISNVNNKNKNQEEREKEKMNRISIINKNRDNLNFNDLDINYSKSEELKINNNNTNIYLIIKTTKEENEKLKKANIDLMEKTLRFESEIRNLKFENSKLKEFEINYNALNKENSKYIEELEKFKILNKDRLDYLLELEEKNTIIFDLKNKMNIVENEINNLIKTENSTKKKNKELNILLEEQELNIKEVKQSLYTKEKEKDDLANLYQKKLETLQINVFKNSEETIGNEDNLSNIIKFTEILNDSLSDLKTQLSVKITNLLNSFTEIKEKFLKSESSINIIIKENYNEVIETINKIKNSFDDDINRARFKVKSQNKSKTNDIIEWYKKQVQELHPFKYKYNTLENQFKNIENSNKLLNITIEDYKLKIESMEKCATFNKEKIDNLNRKISDLKAKYLDIKNFVLNRISNQYLDEFNKFYNDNKKY
jgi:serine/threonine protein kinase